MNQTHLLRQAHDAHHRRSQAGQGGGAGLQITTKASLQDARTSYARETTELLLSGAIGPVREAHFWTGTHCPAAWTDRRGSKKPAAGMNWDQWCGPSLGGVRTT